MDAILRILAVPPLSDEITYGKGHPVAPLCIRQPHTKLKLVTRSETRKSGQSNQIGKSESKNVDSTVASSGREVQRC